MNYQKLFLVSLIILGSIIFITAAFFLTEQSDMNTNLAIEQCEEKGLIYDSWNTGDKIICLDNEEGNMKYFKFENRLKDEYFGYLFLSMFLIFPSSILLIRRT